VRLQEPSERDGRRPNALHEADMLRMPRGRKAGHVLVYEPEQLTMKRIEAACAHHGFGAAGGREIVKQREAGRGVELGEAAAVEDEALHEPQAQRTKRLGDRGKMRQPPCTCQIEDARVVLDLLLDPEVG